MSWYRYWIDWVESCRTYRVAGCAEGVRKDGDETPDREDNSKTDDAPKDGLLICLPVVRSGLDDEHQNVIDDEYDRDSYEHADDGVADTYGLLGQAIEIPDRGVFIGEEEGGDRTG